MVKEIDGLPGQRPQVTGANHNTKSARDRIDDSHASSSSTSATSDQVSLTSSAQLLKELGDAVEASSATDQRRIDAIRQALADGHYAVDASRIADRLLSLDEQL